MHPYIKQYSNITKNSKKQIMQENESMNEIVIPK